MSIITVLTLASCGGGNKTSPSTEPATPNDSVGPARVIAAPNGSVVTAKVLDVIQSTSGVGGRMVVEIQAAEIAPGFRSGISAVDIGKTFTMWTLENISELKKGQVITAYVTFVGDERGSSYLARDIKKRTE